MAQSASPQHRPTVSGALASETWPLLRVGDSGEAVRQLQMELSRIGTFNSAEDGVYGPSTEAAVRQFQQQQGLTPDGVVGPQTWQALALAQTPITLFAPEILSEVSLLTFTPLTFSQPAPPPSPLWLLLMPLIPLIGGALTYLQRRLRGRKPLHDHRPHRSFRSRKSERDTRF